MFTAKAKSRPDTLLWEQFCKDEAKRAAHDFLEKVRRLQAVDQSSMEIPENVFATKFSAHFMDEVMDLTGGPPGDLSGEFSRKKSGPGKSWWNIFKRRQSRDDKNMAAVNKNDNFSAARGRVYTAGENTILEAHVKMLDMKGTSHALTWQPCRLLLTSEQDNNQLEIYCPPKSTFPKMTLFCFLLKDVRSSTDLELPDSVSCFVVKSDNHGEYVFDTGSEKEKENWITIIRSYSARLNGTIISKFKNRSTGGGGGGGGGTEQGQVRRPNYDHHALVSFPVLPHHDERGAQPAVAGCDDVRPMLKSFSASPSPCRSNSLLRHQNQNSSITSSPCGSEASMPEREAPSFFRCRPQRSNPNPKPRRALSMYEQGSLPRSKYPNHSHSHSHSQSHTPTSPSPSPPLPKRSQRSLSSLSEVAQHPGNSLELVGAQNTWRGSSNPAIVTSASTPGADDAADNPFSSNPGNLDTCSQNSSSSALHPVTLAANTHPRTRSGRNSSVSSLNASPTAAPKHPSRSQLSPCDTPRKLSTATSASPSGSTNWTQDIEEEVRKAKQRFPSCGGLCDDVDLPGPNGFSILANSSSSPDCKRKHDNSPSPPFSRANLPSPSASPSVLRRFSPTLNPYIEEQDERHNSRDSEVIEVFPGGDTDVPSGATCLSPGPTQQEDQPHPKPYSLRFSGDGAQLEPLHVNSRQSRTPSPSSGGATTTSEPRQPAVPEESNGIFIEVYGPLRRAPGLPIHTMQPYASWAVTHQDAENLRNLVQFPWFHGMISRANATQLVLAEGETDSGKYLVRQSESREGEFVLTFNYKGRSKHLRIVVDAAGCSVQHLFFTTVPNMLDYFKQNTIPLETCWSEDDCRITEFIDRSASDSFRTITAIYHEKLLSSPRMPRRSHSLHIALTQAVVSMQQNTASGATPGEGASRRQRRGSSSLPQNTRQSTGWRQLFWPNRAHTLQRRHSEVSSVLHSIENNYTSRI